MKYTFIVNVLIFIFLVSQGWSRTSVVPLPPQTIKEVTTQLAGKTEIEQLVFLSYWRREQALNSYCNQKLDELYLNNPKLFEVYARLSKGNSFVIRAVCFEFLHRHRNYNVDLPLDDKELLEPITSYDEGLLEFRKQWAIYRIGKAVDPQRMLDNIKASEPQNAMFFEELSQLPFIKK